MLDARDAEWRHVDGRGAVCVARDAGSLGFPADEVAKRHGASVEADTMDGDAADGRIPGRERAAYRDGWLG